MNLTKTINIRGVAIGSGDPKICMPLIGETESEFLLASDEALVLKPDLVEVRADYYNNVADDDALLAMLGKLREKLPMPILFTLRDKAEGGARWIDLLTRTRLFGRVIRSGLVDLADIELSAAKNDLGPLINDAKSHNVAIVLSAHFFESTPPKDVMVDLLREMRFYDADIAKLAVMPNQSADVLELLSAAEQMRGDGPLIAVAMGRLGLISRVAGGVFGNAVTFGAGANASAPGQIPVNELRAALELFHR